MSVLTRAVKSGRKRRPCAWNCGSPIEPGRPYVRIGLPPWSDGNESDHWWTGAAHGPFVEQCPTFVHGTPHPAMDAVERAAPCRDGEPR